MGDDTLNITRDQLLESKLETMRVQMAAGFASLESAMKAHVKDDDERHAALDTLMERVRLMELEQARESTKLKLIMAVMSVSSGGLGAVLAKFVM